MDVVSAGAGGRSVEGREAWLIVNCQHRDFIGKL